MKSRQQISTFGMEIKMALIKKKYGCERIGSKDQ